MRLGALLEAVAAMRMPAISFTGHYISQRFSLHESQSEQRGGDNGISHASPGCDVHREQLLKEEFARVRHPQCLHVISFPAKLEKNSETAHFHHKYHGRTIMVMVIIIMSITIIIIIIIFIIFITIIIIIIFFIITITITITVITITIIT
jgi:K+-sensing histidine kinase KdpD